MERANLIAPQQSRIFKEASRSAQPCSSSSHRLHQMILVTYPSKPFDYNAKGNIRRNPILQRYSQEIDALYAAVERSVQPDIAPPSDWNASSTQAFIRADVHRVLVRPVSDEADLFRSGCDRYEGCRLMNGGSPLICSKFTSYLDQKLGPPRIA